MKAILKLGRERKEVDVKYVGKTHEVKFYQDTKDQRVYPEDVVEFKEYYGS